MTFPATPGPGHDVPSHLLSGTFLNRLSVCIFEWESKDVELLERAKLA